MFEDLSKIWEYIDSCSDQCRCAMVLYLLLISDHEYGIITDSGVGTLGHVWDIVDGLNSTEK